MHQRKAFVHIPETVSKEAQEFLSTLQDPALLPPFPFPDDFAGWKTLQESAERDALTQSEAMVKRFSSTVTESRLGGIPILDIRPRKWQRESTVAIYTHGGACTMLSAASTLGRAAMFAHDTGLRVISVDYTLAPAARFDEITEQVISVCEALVFGGYSLKNAVMYGDSSGGGLAAAVILKMRDQGWALPSAAVLVSPVVDLTPAGDTDFTLRDADPGFQYDKHLKNAAGAYASPEDQKNPYASPIYGDFSKGFPATLIQGGTKEIFLSGFVRLYQALDAAGQSVKLDLYEGMVHNFPMRIPYSPEGKLARKKMKQFVHFYLKQDQQVAA
jgi:monoterpene epsilon-lactone hydrolase